MSNQSTSFRIGKISESLALLDDGKFVQSILYMSLKTDSGVSDHSNKQSKNL
jgi:hypothetical protein